MARGGTASRASSRLRALAAGSYADDRFACRQAAVGGHGGDVPLDLDAVADAAHERGEAPVVRVDGEPARGAVAVVAERVGYLRRRGDESAGGDRDRLGLAPDLEGQFALEDVEGIGVLVVNVRAGYLFARCVPRVGDRDVLARDEDADLALLASKNRLPVGDRDDLASESV